MKENQQNDIMTSCQKLLLQKKIHFNQKHLQLLLKHLSFVTQNSVKVTQIFFHKILLSFFFIIVTNDQKFLLKHFCYITEGKSSMFIRSIKQLKRFYSTEQAYYLHFILIMPPYFIDLLVLQFLYHEKNKKVLDKLKKCINV